MPTHRLIIRSHYYRIGFARIEYFKSEKEALSRIHELNDHCTLESINENR